MQSAKTLSPSNLFNSLNHFQVFDLRSSKAFEKAHFPGAIHLGYATNLGPETGPKARLFVDEKGDYATGHPSGSDDFFLEGGMENFMDWMNGVFQLKGRLVVLAGMTGSGKTELLHRLEDAGEQVLDLEKLARHRGSAFGNMEGRSQLPNFHFQLEVLGKWMAFSAEKPIWVEEEGPFLGRNTLPEGLYARCLETARVQIELDFESRLERILAEYGGADEEKIKAGIERLKKRLGMSAYQKALHRLETGRLQECFSILLHYYDHAYTLRRKESVTGAVHHFPYPKTETELSALARLGEEITSL